MPKTRRSTSMALAQLPQEECNSTPKKVGRKQKKRTVSDRSPAVDAAARKKISTKESEVPVQVQDHRDSKAAASPAFERSHFHSPSARGGDKENQTPDRSSVPDESVQRPTPYWKVAEERGASPRITRSSTKRQSNIPRVDDIEKSDVSKGLFQLELSPPNSKEIRKRELLMEKERDARLEQQRRQEGDVVFLSGKKTKRASSHSQFCLDFSPTDKNALVRMSSASSSITNTSSRFDDLMGRCREIEKDNFSLRTENTALNKENASLKTETAILSKNLVKAEQQLDKIGSEKNRLMIENTKLEYKIHSHENPEWNKDNQSILHRVVELEENVGKYKSDRSNSQSRAHLQDLHQENESLKKRIEELNGKLKERDSDQKTRFAATKKELEEVEANKTQMADKLESALALVQKTTDEIKLTKQKLDEKDAALVISEQRVMNMKKDAEESETVKAKMIREKEAESAGEKSKVREIDALRAELNDKNMKLISLEELCIEARRAADEKISQVDSSMKKLCDQEDEIKELCEQHESNERQIENQQSQITNVTNSLTASEQIKKQLENEISTMQMKIEASNRNYAELERKLKHLMKENDGFRSELDKNNRDNKQMISQHRELHIALASATSENNEKEKKIFKMMEEMNSINGRESDLMQKIIRQEEVRRTLHNRVIQLSGNIRVFIRVRPMIPSETTNSKKEITPFSFPSVFDNETKSSGIKAGDDLTKRFIVAMEPVKDRGGLSQRRKKLKFGFDNVFDPNNNQEDIWEATEPLIQSAVDGYNVCVFAYGQTGSGKTYTMLGGGNASNAGIITKAIEKLFAAKRLLEDTTKRKTSVNISIELIEVYNEQVRDLMNSQKDGCEFKRLNVSVNSNEAVGNKILSVSNEKEVFKILGEAQGRRCVKATKSNEESSRSHLIFTMNFVVNHGSKVVRKSKLHVCDLAGSERLSKSHAVGSTLNETKHINKSLSTLSNVIAKLQQKSKHVPFRESKLTYLLRNSLGGDSKTLAIVCCNPLSKHFQETSCSLRFAQNLNKVELQNQGNISC